MDRQSRQHSDILGWQKQFTNSMLETALLGTRFFDSYKTVGKYEPIPNPISFAAAAFITIGKYEGYKTGAPGTATPIEFLKDKHEKSISVATALAKFDYVMSSDYRYLMVSGYGSRAMMEELDTLKGQTQQREYTVYNSNRENAAYKAAILDYIDKISSMNKHYEDQNSWLNFELIYLKVQ